MPRNSDDIIDNQSGTAEQNLKIVEKKFRAYENVSKI